MTTEDSPEIVLGPRTFLRTMLDGTSLPGSMTLIRIADPVRLEDWVDVVRRDVNRALTRAHGPQAYGRACVQRERLLDGFLTVLNRPSHRLVHWSYSVGGHHVAGGRLRKHVEGADVEASAVYREEHRGRRLYPAILAKLKSMLGRKIWSDKQLSTGALRMWKRIGEYDPARSRFRNNPGPPRRSRLPRRLARSVFPMEAEEVREALTYLSTYGRKGVV